MKGFRAWQLGLLLIIGFVFLSELTIVFKEYFYSRLGLNRNLILILLWTLPAVASFLAVFLPQNRKIILGLSYIPILSFLGPVAHFLLGLSGVPIDFGGLAGLRVTFLIYLTLSAVIIGVGAVAGMLFGKKDRS